jgi:hypothetical protein
VTPGSFFTDVINNCESQFQVNKLRNKLSGKEAIKKLRTLKKEFQKAAKEHSKDIKNEIVKKMIDCNGDGAIASSSAVGSCTPAKLNMSSPGFCTKAAFSCSTNMKKCTEKAQKFVKDIKDDRAKRRDNYNQTVDLTRKQMVGMFNDALKKYTKDAKSLGAMFGGAEFRPPTDFPSDLKGGAQFMSESPYVPADPGDKLDLKDPEAYLNMVQKNITSLKSAVEKQQEAILSPNAPLNQHIKDTEDNYKTQVVAKAKKIEGDCLAAYNSYKTMLEANAKQAADKALADQKLLGQMGEKNGALCGAYNDIMSDNPNGACKEDIRDLATASLNASSQAGRMGNTAEVNQMVNEMNARCQNLGKESKDAIEICQKSLPTTFKDYFKEQASLEFSAACAVVQNPKKDLDRPEADRLCVEGTRITKTATTSRSGTEKPSEDMSERPDELSEFGEKDCNPWKYTSDGEGTTPTKKYSKTCSMPGIPNCENFQKLIVGIYSNGLQTGQVNSSSQGNSMPSTCSANDNSGPYNTKNWMNPGGSNNPMDGRINMGTGY